jgi:hypothetical protein
MVDAARDRIGAAATNALDDGVIIDVKQQEAEDHNGQSEKGLALGAGAREAVQDETSFQNVALFQSLVDEANHDLIADKAACLHHHVGLLAQLRTGFHSLSEDVSGGDVHEIRFGDDQFALRAFSHSWWPEDQEPHWPSCVFALSMVVVVVVVVVVCVFVFVF